MNILTDKPIDKVVIDGAEYQINTDFRISVQFELIIQSDIPNNEKIKQALMLYYPVIPKNIEKAVDKILEFYADIDNNSSSNRRSKGERAVPVYSFKYDAEYIYAAFMQAYNIDLQAVEYLHWHKFRALFKSLPETCEFTKIMGYRAMEIPNDLPKKQREHYQKLKKIYALPISENAKKMQNELEEALLNGGDVSAIINKYKG